MRRVGHPARPGRDRGQATVELALGLPIVFVGVLLILQLVLVGRDAVLVTHAAREGARAAAVVPTDRAARAGAEAASTALARDRLHVSLDRSRGRATVRIEYRSLTRLPVVGHLVPDVTLHGSATMALEPPH